MNIKINNEWSWKAHLDLHLADQLIFKVDVLESTDNKIWKLIDTHQFHIKKVGEFDENGFIQINDEVEGDINKQFHLKLQEIKNGYNLG